MIIECCSQERSYQRFYGLLGERFCHLNQMWVEHFDATFQQQVSDIVPTHPLYSQYFWLVCHSTSLGDKQASQCCQVLCTAVLH